MKGRIEPILKALNDAGVRYLVVGGVAMVLHGRLRATGDLDLVVHLEPENLDRALEVFESEGFQPRAPVALQSFADEDVRNSWIETKNLEVFSMWHESTEGFEVDLFVEEPLDFESAWSRRVDVRLETTTAPIVGIDDLLDLKRRAGRAIDLEDAAFLESLSEETTHD